MAHVAGYTVANDYAIRDYLENWYRPNLRVKNRDGGTVLGPWLVDAPTSRRRPQLDLRTSSTGSDAARQYPRPRLRHPGADRIPQRFHDAAPGDVILTGTPEGVVDVTPATKWYARSTASAGWSTPLSAMRLRPHLQVDGVTARGSAMRVQHLIDGRPVEGRDYFETVNPATQEVLAEVAARRCREVDAAVGAAKAAFPAWAGKPAAERAKVMRSSAT